MAIYYTRYDEIGLFVQGFLMPPKPKSQGRGPGNEVNYSSLVRLNNELLMCFLQFSFLSIIAVLRPFSALLRLTKWKM